VEKWSCREQRVFGPGDQCILSRPRADLKIDELDSVKGIIIDFELHSDLNLRILLN
jgi:hypothetical protein